MATADELLATSGSIDKTLVIDNDLRVIKIPSGVPNLGVVSDDEVLELNFRMPRYIGDIDLSTFSIRINYYNANNEGDLYTIDKTTINPDSIEFSWLVGPNATKVRGTTKFNVCAIKTDSDGRVLKEFNTTPATLAVLEGLEANQKAVSLYTDVIEQWRQKLFGNGNAGNNNSGNSGSSGGSTYTLPVATAETLGGVRPVAKTEDMTQSVGVDENGGLWTAFGGGNTTGDGWRLIRTITIPADVTTDTSGITWFTTDAETPAVNGFAFDVDEDGNSFEIGDYKLYGLANMTNPSQGNCYIGDISMAENVQQVKYTGYRVNLGKDNCVILLSGNRFGDRSFPTAIFNTQYVPTPTITTFSGGLGPNRLEYILPAYDFTSFAIRHETQTFLAGSVFKFYGKEKKV